MKIVFITNYLNHHQKYLADELYLLLGDGNYFLIETTGMPEYRKKLGYPQLSAPYLLKYSESTHEQIDGILNSFDVVMYTSTCWSYVKNRLNDRKLTFCYSERRYKRLRRYLKYPINTYLSYYINKGYLLCSGAFTAKDYLISKMPLRNCFKWGYFPEVKIYDDIDILLRSKSNKTEPLGVSILWVGRLLGWKHPEAAVKLACKLRRDGISFKIDIIGNGKLESSIKNMIERYGLKDYVKLLGSMPPDEVRKRMELADIFLFTSNRQEGWGVVLNESMNSACAVVASDAVGSVKYLVTDGVNGLTYNNGDNDDLYKKVRFLIDHPNERKSIQTAAYKTITTTWSANNAANNFIILSQSLLQGLNNPILEGPCSQAPLLWDKWII